MLEGSGGGAQAEEKENRSLRLRDAGHSRPCGDHGARGQVSAGCGAEWIGTLFGHRHLNPRGFDEIKHCTFRVSNVAHASLLPLALTHKSSLDH